MHRQGGGAGGLGETRLEALAVFLEATALFTMTPPHMPGQGRRRVRRTPLPEVGNFGAKGVRITLQG